MKSNRVLIGEHPARRPFLPALLASILAMGGGLPQPAGVGTAVQAKGNEAVRAGTSQDENKAPLAPSTGQSGQVAGIIGGMGPDPTYLFSRGGSGLSPKDWGMSAACRRMVLKNREIARRNRR